MQGNTDHSDKNQPLFKQEPATGSPRISLRDYISQHLSGDASAQERPSPPPSVNNLRPRVTQPFPAEHAVGHRLNSLDTELGAGLEQYLPTPLFRLRVMKKRLNDEIAALRGTLNKYERLPEHSRDLKRRIDALREHLLTLELHQAQVDAELELYLANDSIFYGAFKQLQGWGKTASKAAAWLRQGLVKLLYGKKYRAMEESGSELRLLQELFAERLQDPDAPEQELGQLLNRYEQALRRFEASASQLKQKPAP